MDLALEDVTRNRAANQGRCDIVEEARQYEHKDQQGHAALPVVGEQSRHLVGNSAVFEMTRQECKSHQQQEQIGQRDPFMRQVLTEAAKSGTILKAGEDQLVDGDGSESGQRDRKRVMME